MICLFAASNRTAFNLMFKKLTFGEVWQFSGIFGAKRTKKQKEEWNFCLFSCEFGDIEQVQTRPSQRFC